MGSIVAGDAPAPVRIVVILEALRHRAGAALDPEPARGVVDRLRVGVVDQELKPLGESALRAELQRIVIRGSARRLADLRLADVGIRSQGVDLSRQAGARLRSSVTVKAT